MRDNNKRALPPLGPAIVVLLISLAWLGIYTYAGWLLGLRYGSPYQGLAGGLIIGIVPSLLIGLRIYRRSDVGFFALVAIVTVIVLYPVGPKYRLVAALVSCCMPLVYGLLYGLWSAWLAMQDKSELQKARTTISEGTVKDVVESLIALRSDEYLPRAFERLKAEPVTAVQWIKTKYAESKHPLYRDVYISALKELAHPAASKLLYELIEHEDDILMLGELIEAYGHAGETEIPPCFRELVSDAMYADMIIKALKRIDTPEAREMLLKAVEDPDS